MTREEIKEQAKMEIERAYISVNAVNAIFEATFGLSDDDDPMSEYREDEVAAMRRRR